MLEYTMTPDEGEPVLALRRKIEALGWRTGWDMEQDAVFGGAEWLLVAEDGRGSTVECRKLISHAELRQAVCAEMLCRLRVQTGWRQVLDTVEGLSA